MASIIDPTSTRAVAVRAGQTLRLQASAATNWYLQTNGGGYTTQIGTSVDTLLWTAPSIARRFTFDDVQIGVGSGSVPTPTIDDFIDLNVCEGPTTVLQVSAQARNEAVAEPPLKPESGSDDPPLGFPLLMPGANRDGLGTELLETASSPGGPANLSSVYGPGLFTDTSGNLGARTPIAPLRGLGPFPTAASFYHTYFYFNHDFGRSRALGLTRVLFADSAGGNAAVVRGDGRRNSYRATTGGNYDAAASLRNSLTYMGGVYTELTPAGTYYEYTPIAGGGALVKVVDRYGNPVYYAYNAIPGTLKAIHGLPGAAASGLVAYFEYSGGLCSTLSLRDLATPANDRTTYFHYDGDRNVVKLIGPELCITYFEYNNAALASAVHDPEGFRTYLAYDGSGRVERIIDPLGNTAYFAYDTSTGPITTLKDRAGKATYFLYNAFGSPTAVFNVGTPGDYYAYDGEGNLLSSRNRLGNQWTYEYDSAANRISVTDPLAAQMYFAYDSALDVLNFTRDPLGRFMYFAYDANRNRTAAVDPLDKATYFDYTSVGLMRFRKDRRGACTYFAFDAKANLTGIVDPLANTTYYDYNSAGEQTAVVDPLARISYMSYDKRGRVTQTRDPAGGTRQFAYDARCNLVTEVDPRSNATYHTYDGNSNRTKTVDPLGNATYFRYDAEERLLGQKDARLFETTHTYDVLGRPQTQVDPLGGTKYFAYDAAHETYFTLDERGNPTYLQYDVTGRLERQYDALQNRTYFGYDLKGNRVLERDARNNGTTYTYDLRDLPTHATNAIGAVTYSGYDQEHNRVLALDPREAPTYFEYDLRGLQTQTRDAYQNSTYSEYDAAAQRVRELADPQNDTSVRAATYFDYDLAGRQQHVRDAYQAQTYMGYDLAGNNVVSVNQRGFATYYSYDAANREQQVIDPGQLRTYVAYDAVGNRLRTDVEQGWGRQPWGYSPWGGERVSTYFTYDALNRQETALSPSSRYSPTVSLTYMGYDAAGNQVQTRVENPRGGADVRYSYFAHDVLNRRTHSINPLVAGDSGPGIAYHGYDAVSNRVLDLDEEDRPTYMTFDAVNREATRSDAFGNSWSKLYDLRNAVLADRTPDGVATYFEYDLLGRRSKEWDKLQQLTYTGYDARSEQIVVVNPRGYGTYFTFDLLGRAATRKDALGGVRSFGYDELGNAVLQIDELGNPTYFTYDRLNQQQRIIDALGATTYVQYDAAGLLRRRIDADGRVTSFGYYGYDAARRPLTQSFTYYNADRSQLLAGDPWVYLAYDSLGNVTETQDEAGTTTNTFDVLNRLSKKVTHAGAVYYTYDRAGLKLRLKDPTLNESYYAYDATGRLARLDLLDGTPRSAEFQYDSTGRLTLKRLPNAGISPYYAYNSYYTYDLDGRLRRLQSVGSDPVGASAVTLTYFYYDYDANNNTTYSRREDDLTTYIEYDALDRVTREHWTDGVGGSVYGFTYSYDAGSNRKTKSDFVAIAATYYDYDGRNLVTTEKLWVPSGPSTTYTYYAYDLAQRMTMQRVPAGLTTYFAHNQRDKIARMSQVGSANGPRSFFYNGLGEPVIVIDSDAGVPSYWAHDGNNLIFVREPTGAVAYYRHNDLRSAPSRTNESPAKASPVECKDAAGTCTPLADGRGNIQKMRAMGDGAVPFKQNYTETREVVGALDTSQQLRQDVKSRTSLTWAGQDRGLTVEGSIPIPEIGTTTVQSPASPKAWAPVLLQHTGDDRQQDVVKVRGCDGIAAYAETKSAREWYRMGKAQLDAWILHVEGRALQDAKRLADLWCLLHGWIKCVPPTIVQRDRRFMWYPHRVTVSSGALGFTTTSKVVMRIRLYCSVYVRGVCVRRVS